MDNIIPQSGLFDRIRDDSGAVECRKLGMEAVNWKMEDGS